MRLKIEKSLLRDDGWLEFDCGDVVLSMPPLPYTTLFVTGEEPISVLCSAMGIPGAGRTTELHGIEFDLPDSLLPYATTKFIK